MISTQQSLFSEPWDAFLSRELRRPVAVRFGKAQQAVLRYRRDRTGAVQINMNAFFVQAPEEIRAAVAVWLRAGKRARRATTLLDSWIVENLRRIEPMPPRRTKLQIRGKYHDLRAIAATLWDEFPSLLSRKPALSWGFPGSSKRRRRSLRLGSYNERARLVRIHPALDQDFVPDWFVRYILFHELLHAELGVGRRGSKKVFHGPEFRRREKSYADYARAIAWERRHLRQLLAFTTPR